MAAVPAAASASTRAGAHPVHARREGVRRQRHLRARAAAQLLQGLPLREDRCGCAGEGSGLLGLRLRLRLGLPFAGERERRQRQRRSVASVQRRPEPCELLNHTVHTEQGGDVR